ncbi:hypothetical protein LTR72_000217 [Exophiala xenobiotica]|nr:hypothetical protein LTR72_000217 [Exophiala xenobiotica]KAK5299551.1 hypothetical protein LTR14_001765 [Exophiala xenobiotica]KAK5499610.1 hypothetical protein LTR55_000433 [Exophiala xenobiotica]
MEADVEKSHTSTVGQGVGAGVTETIEAEVSPDFTIECPVRPPKRRLKRKRSSVPEVKDNVHIDQDAPELAPNLHIEYAVRPGHQWRKMTKYKNAKFKEPFDVIYSSGQIIYVNRHTPVRPSPPADASEDEKLQYDKENFWVGLISDFRAESQDKVYVRVFWLYWPEELPMGRQPYHGKRELVLSNHVDLIEAQAIASHAEISQWDENDDSNKTVLQELYWRQTLDLKKLARDPGRALSKLREFCICGGYDNPSLDMYQCHKVRCGTWNHEACLVKAIEERAWEKFKKGALTHEVQEREESKGLAQKVGETVSHLAHRAFGIDEVKTEPQSTTTAIANGNKKLKAATDDKRPWTGKLQGQIIKVDRGDADDTHYATVTQYVPKSRRMSAPSSPSDFEPKIWHMKLGCLKCGAALN